MKGKIATCLFLLLSIVACAQESVERSICIAPFKVLPVGAGQINYQFGYFSMAMAHYIFNTKLLPLPKYDPPRANDPRYMNDSVSFAPFIQAIISAAFVKAGNLRVVPMDNWGIAPNVKELEKEPAYIREAKKHKVDFLITGDIFPIKLTHETTTGKNGKARNLSKMDLHVDLQIIRIDTTRYFYPKYGKLVDNSAFFDVDSWSPTDSEAIGDILRSLEIQVQNYVEETFTPEISVKTIIDKNGKGGAAKILAKAPQGCVFFGNDKNLKESLFSIVEYTATTSAGYFKYETLKAQTVGKAHVVQINESGENQFRVTSGDLEVAQKLAQGKKLFLVPAELTSNSR